MKTHNTLQLLLLAAIWGSSYPLIKTLVPEIGIISTLGARIFVAAIVLLATSPFTGSFPDFRKSWKYYFVLGALNVVIPGLLVIYSVNHLNASLGSILNATSPMFTLMIASLWLKQKISEQQVAGLVLGLAGIIIIVGWNPVPGGKNTYMAVLSSLLAAFSYGMGANYARSKGSKEAPLKTTNGIMAAASILILPFVLTNYEPVNYSSFLLLKIIIIGAVCTAIGFTLFIRLIEKIGSVKTSMVSILVPVSGIAWSAIFLNEIINIHMLFGLLLVATSVYFVLTNKTLFQIPSISFAFKKKACLAC